MIILIYKTKVNLFGSSSDFSENPLHQDLSGLHYNSNSPLENNELENYIINQNLNSNTDLH